MSMKPNEHTLELSKEEQAGLLKELIHQFKKDWMTAKVQEAIYTAEFADPKHITKAQAMDSLGTYQKRIRFLEENITAIKTYAKNNDIIDI